MFTCSVTRDTCDHGTSSRERRPKLRTEEFRGRGTGGGIRVPTEASQSDSRAAWRGRLQSPVSLSLMVGGETGRLTGETLSVGSRRNFTGKRGLTWGWQANGFRRTPDARQLAGRAPSSPAAEGPHACPVGGSYSRGVGQVPCNVPTWQRTHIAPGAGKDVPPKVRSSAPALWAFISW